MTVNTAELRSWAGAQAPVGDALRDRARAAADEIDRLREENTRLGTLLDTINRECNRLVEVAGGIEGDNAQLRALLAEARPAVDSELATIALIESSDVVALADLLARIDAALGEDS